MSVSPSPVPVRTTVLPYLTFRPSVLTCVVAALAVVAVVVYVVQTLRVPTGSRRGFRWQPYVDARLGLGSMVAMVVLVALTVVAARHDQSVHKAALRAQAAQEAAIQTEVKGALSAYYGVEFVAENERIYSDEVSARSGDQLPGEPVSLRLPDGTVPDRCYVGHRQGFYVLSCGPADAAVPLAPSPGH